MTTTIGQTVFSPWLTPVRLVAVANIAGTYYNGPNNNGVEATLTVAASSLTIDGVVCALGDRVLLQAQTNTFENGIYVVKTISSTVVLERAADQQSREQMRAGQYVSVGAGNTRAGTLYTFVEPLPNVIGVDALTFSLDLSAVFTNYLAVPITAAEFNGMYAAPKLLVPAPGANKLLVLNQAQLLMTYNSAAYAAGGTAAIQYDSTVNGAGVIASTTLANTLFQGTVSIGLNLNPGVVTETFSTCVNKGFYLSNITTAYTTGNSPFVLHIWYAVIPTA